MDVDPDHGGMTSLRALVDEHGQMPAGPRVRTGSGGWHLYYQHPSQTIRNSAGTHLGTGIDIRGDGGYVIAPPSQHHSRTAYEWRGLDLPVPNLPDWALERLTHAPTRQQSVPSAATTIGRPDAWARAALTGETETVSNAPEGTRNQTLNRAAFCLGQIVATGALDLTTVESVLFASACRAGLGEAEARKTLHSGLTAGMDHPRLAADNHATPSTRATIDIAPDHAIEIG